MSSTRTDPCEDESTATDWIADATRRLAGMSAPGSTVPPVDRRWGDDVIDRLRAIVATRIATLPRRSRPVSTLNPAITMTEFAVSRALTAALSTGAAAESAAIADIHLELNGTELAGVSIHLVAMGTEDRARTLLDSGESLRAQAVDVVERTIGKVVEVRVDATWEDALLPGPHGEKPA